MNICEHDYEDSSVEPTCGSYGYELHTCKICGDQIEDSYVEPTGEHKLGEWYPNGTGVLLRDCENCDYFEAMDDPDYE